MDPWQPCERIFFWTAFSSPSCCLESQTIVVFEGDTPAYNTFCPLWSAELKEFHIQINVFLNRPGNSAQTWCLAASSCTADCSPCTSKCLGAEPCVGVSSCSLQRSSRDCRLSPELFARGGTCRRCQVWSPLHPVAVLAHPTSLSHTGAPALDPQPGQPFVELRQRQTRADAPERAVLPQGLHIFQKCLEVRGT